ncbi:MAG: hypothetical protein KDB01_25450 [Planctomycetaceae bacterium]|nr:hypothetical protein [Planctomycetaceae bacterium]
MVAGKMVSTVSALTMLAMLCGCSNTGDRPELGEVSGIVTLNGEPLPYAGVHFRPESGGRTASGYTGADGKFESTYLKYPNQVMGAKVGSNHVVITTNVDPSDLEGVSRKDLDEDAIREEKVPECYRGPGSILKVDVKEGRNSLAFELTDGCAPTGTAL